MAEDGVGVGIEVENTPERLGEYVDCIELHDIDRNLFRTERFAELIEETVEYHGVSREEVQQMRSAVESTGGSFDIFAALRKRYKDSPAVVDAIKTSVLREAIERKDLDYDDEKCLFYRGARELIDKKPLDGSVRAFVTRGGKETQMLKLEIFGVDLEEEYYAIVPMKNKTSKAQMCVDSYDKKRQEFYFRWLVRGKPSDGGGSKLVNIWAKKVIVIDDKPSELMALGELPKEKAIGFLHRSGDGTLSQKLTDELPDNIFEIRSLYEVGQFRSRLGRIALGSTKEWTRENYLRAA